MKDVLLVDGYNIIGAWPELRELAAVRLEDARDRLTELLADYQGFTGKRVIVVFDAHQVPGLGGKYREGGLEIIYTREKETADECIERLVGELGGRRVMLQVASADMTEQHVSFGRGALRVTPRELLLAVSESQTHVRKTVEQPPPRKSSFDNALTEDMKKLLEKWRRGKW